MQIDRIDHFVLTVRDIQATCDFYSRVLGMRVESFSEGRIALCFGRQKINLHQAGREFEPKAQYPTPGSADFCLITSTPLDEVVAQVRSLSLPLVAGPVPKTGALGAMTSIYLRDPDANLVEISVYNAPESGQMPSDAPSSEPPS
ncbi:MAG TPA: VOC family protein [Ktedonobacterales bacterium]